MPTSIRRHWLLFPALALALATATPAVAAKGPFILVDADSGQVIAQHEAGRQWYPASVTKLMTVFLTLRAVRAAKVALDTPFRVSENALAQPPSKMGFPVGTQITVDNALKILLVKSANDIAVVLAEGVAGSVPAFVAEMNKATEELGMNGTQFRNPHGLPDDQQVTTARDMALLARALMREFPEHELLFRIPAIRVGKRLLRNHNKLIDRYPGADGMKTGFICSSGFNVVATAKRGNKHLIAVVFGSHSSMQRTEETARLFEAGFGSTLSIASLFAANRPLLEKIENVAVGPIDLRDEMCSRKRRRPASEEDEEDPEADPESGLALLRTASKQSFLIDLPPSMPPIRVFIGPASKPNYEPVLPAASRKGKRTKAKTKTKAKDKAAPKSKAAPKAAPKSKTAPKAAPKSKTAPKAAPKKKSKK